MVCPAKPIWRRLEDNKMAERKSFKISTKKIEWMLAAGKDPKEYTEKKKFYETSYCRECKTKLMWGDGSYSFDHKDNNPANNRQSNCYLVCRNCHGKATRTKKIRERGFFGVVVGYKTIKLKVGYKKRKAKKGK